MAIEGVLARRKCAEKWCATFWDPCSQFSVTGNCQIFNFHDFLHFGAPNGGPQGSPPMGSLGLPRVPLPWGVRDPLPWDRLGSQGFPLPWVPSHGIPLGSQGSPPMGSHPTSPSFFVRPGRKLTTKELTRGFLARSHVWVEQIQ